MKETFATGMVNPKTTALFFDKLWIHPLLANYFFGKVPSEVLMVKPLGLKKYYIAYENNIGQFGWAPSKSAPFEEDELLDETGIYYKTKLPSSYRSPKTRWPREFYSDDSDSFELEQTFFRNKAIYEISKEYEKLGINLVPIYHNLREFFQVTKHQNLGFEICLDYIPMIDEENLTWKQVLEVRKDKIAKEKLNRLRRWFSSELLNKSEEEIRNVLEQKLEDYQWALKKHSIKTTIGGFIYFISAISAPATLTALTGEIKGALAAGIAIGGAGFAWISNMFIEKTEIEREEVAYIYLLRKKLGKE